MNAVIKNKIQYVIYSPFVWLTLFLKGISNEKLTFWNGFPILYKAKGSRMLIQKGCKFASNHSANPLGNNHPCCITTLTSSSSIVIGRNCGFSAVAISCAKNITLENNVRCGANATIMDNDGHWDDFRSGSPKPVYIENHVWIGANSLIMKDVRIGRYAMIGSGAVVRSSVPPYAIVTGNPAKIVGFSKTPEEIIEFEKGNYPEEERLPFEILEKNYNKYFLKRLKEIKEFTRL